MKSLSHSTKNPSTVTPTGLSGPDALRAYFAPRQVLRLNETAQVLNYSYSHFFRRIQAGTLSLRIRKNEVGERFVLLDDLIAYLFPPADQDASSPPPPKRKPGRPRKTVTSDGQKGGVR
jgi:predicted DNA-binding transcriptional regulator AlpA